MAKIPFDIKFRPQIENGEYKVVYVENSSTEQYPIEILKWDSNSDAGCIIGCIRLNGKDRVYAFGENGEHKVSGGDNRLFIVTPEPEMSEWQTLISGCLQKYGLLDGVADKIAKESAAELLALATEELKKTFVLLHKDDYQTAFDLGKAEALKDLPRWEKQMYAPQEVNIYLPTNELVYYGMAISINDLTKLPGFKEDESHE